MTMTDDDDVSAGAPTTVPGSPVTGASVSLPPDGLGGMPSALPGSLAPAGGLFGGNLSLQGLAAGLLSTPHNAGFAQALANGLIGSQIGSQFAMKKAQEQLGLAYAPAMQNQAYQSGGLDLQAKQLNNQLQATVTNPAKLAAFQQFQNMSGQGGIPGTLAPQVQQQPLTQQPPQVAPQGQAGSPIPAVSDASLSFTPPQQSAAGGLPANAPPMGQQQIQQMLQQQGNPVASQPPGAPVPQAQGNRAVVTPQQAMSQYLLGTSLGLKDPGALLPYAMPSNGMQYGTDANGNAVVTAAPGYATAQGQIEGAKAGASDSEHLAYAAPIAAATAMGKANAESKAPLSAQDLQKQQMSVQDKFNDYAPVKEYREAGPAIGSLMSAAQSNDRASTIPLIDAGMKILNPGRSVNTGSLQIALHEMQGLPDQIRGEIIGAFSNGSTMSPAAKQAWLNAVTDKVNQYRTSYVQAAQDTTTAMNKNGLDGTKLVADYVDPLTQMKQQAAAEMARRQAAKTVPAVQ